MENFIKEVEVDGVSHSITLGDNMVGSGLKKDENGVVSLDINEEKLVKITYSELKTLKDGSQLVQGTFYRITDYVTTTTQSGTKSANHPFDVIVLALSENALSEEAKAALHEGDTYFADSDISAWELKYCLDNDKTKFEWADETNGKGVIYQMIDENRNNCPYDFKNIMFEKTVKTNKDYYYTFSQAAGARVSDYSFTRYCLNNKIKPYYASYSFSTKRFLNKNIFVSLTYDVDCRNNTFELDCYNNIFIITYNNYASYNTFKYHCYNNTFRAGGYNNVFGMHCFENTFNEFSGYNTFGDGCHYNYFGKASSNNIFSHNCSYNNLENGSNFRKYDGGEDKQVIKTFEEFYDDGSSQLVPTKHPDLSTQPSILPYKFMGQYVYEQLIPHDGDPNHKYNTIFYSQDIAVEKPIFLEAQCIMRNGVCPCNIVSYVTEFEAMSTGNREGIRYIRVVYTSMPEEGDYYGYNNY